jgi:hypothetical protein
VRRGKGGAMVLDDGRARGRYSTRRAPFFIRAVVSKVDGKVDLLDQLADTPNDDEVVHVYQASGPLFCPDTMARTGFAIICPPPGASGTYRHRADVDGEQLRTTDAWRAWCRAQDVDRPMLDGETLQPRELASAG